MIIDLFSKKKEDEAKQLALSKETIEQKIENFNNNCDVIASNFSLYDAHKKGEIMNTVLAQLKELYKISLIEKSKIKIERD